MSQDSLPFFVVSVFINMIYSSVGLSIFPLRMMIKSLRHWMALILIFLSEARLIYF